MAKEGEPHPNPSVFIPVTDSRWPALVERFKQERNGRGPPRHCNAGEGWYFPPDWVNALTTKRDW